MESAVIARPLWNSCYLRARFSVYVSILFGFKKTNNLYEFKYLYPNQTTFQISTTKLFIYFFTIFVTLLQNLVENWQLLLTQPKESMGARNRG
jgi:hypothetical protein